MDNLAIQLALRDLSQRIAAHFEAMPPHRFFAGSEEQWSPAHHLQHLVQANRPVAAALTRPRMATPSAVANSRTYEEVVAIYRQALLAGVARATGPFAPKLDGVALDRAGQLELVERFRTAAEAVAEALAPWGEERLDALSLPHPALGLLTVREMLYFTLHHNRHHSLERA